MGAIVGGAVQFLHNFLQRRRSAVGRKGVVRRECREVRFQRLHCAQALQHGVLIARVVPVAQTRRRVGLRFALFRSQAAHNVCASRQLLHDSAPSQWQHGSHALRLGRVCHRPSAVRVLEYFSLFHVQYQCCWCEVNNGVPRDFNRRQDGEIEVYEGLV